MIKINANPTRKYFLIFICFVMIFNISLTSAVMQTSAADLKPPLFTDVDGNASFYDDLKFLVNLGVIGGLPDGSYAPEKSTSRAEFIKMLIVAADYALTENAKDSFKDTANHWSREYIETAVANKIIKKSSYGTKFSPDEPVSREEMAIFTVNALNIHEYTAPSLYSDTKNKYVNLASGEYILMGYTENGKKVFKPKENLKRADVCRVISCVIQYREDAEAYKNEMILNFIDDNIITTTRQLYDLIRACAANMIETIAAKIKLNKKDFEKASTTYTQLNPEKPSVKGIEFTTYGAPDYDSKLIFYYDLSKEEEHRRSAEVDKVAENFAKTYINAEMTDTEKITAIHTYLVLNCKYDELYIGVTDTSNIVLDETTINSFTAYGALINGIAVCQGYSAAFNLLAKKAGVASVAIGGKAPESSVNHMWNMVGIDGKVYFVDSTWGRIDNQGNIDTAYLLKTESEFRKYGYKWDSSHAKLEYLNK